MTETESSPASETEPSSPHAGLRRVPIRSILPNLVTLLALSAGLTAIRMSVEGRYDFAVYAILIAAVFDALDGRLARYLRVTSRFGAELDSLSDFICFGVAPPFLLFVWNLNGIKSFGWLAVLLFAVAGALRLARFNVKSTEEKPAWQGNFFTGVPAPAGALTVLLPIYVDLVGIDVPNFLAPLIVVYVLVIGALMVSRVPTFSGKKLGRIRRDLALPILIGVLLYVVLLVTYTFQVMAVSALIYLACIPIGWRAWSRLARAHGALEDELMIDITGDDDEAPPA